MTNERNFKKGDIVRYIGKCRCYVETDIDPKDTYAVKSVKDDEVVIDVPSEVVIWEHHLELVKPYDRKTDFLTRLQTLLREFDASIGYFIGDDEEYGWCDYPFLKIGNEIIKYPAGDIDDITADNIMDFDKE